MKDFVALLQEVGLNPADFPQYYFEPQPQYNPREKELILFLKGDKILEFALYNLLKDALALFFRCQIKITFTVSEQPNVFQLNEYLQAYSAQKGLPSANYRLILQEQEVVYFVSRELFFDKEVLQELEAYLQELGIPMTVVCCESAPIKTTITPPPVSMAPVKEVSVPVEKKKSRGVRGSSELELVGLHQRIEEEGLIGMKVSLKGKLLDLNLRTFKSGSVRLEMMVIDDLAPTINAFRVNGFLGKEQEAPVTGKWYCFHGEIAPPDPYNKEVYLRLYDFEEIEAPVYPNDDYPQKRVEFLVRTKMSEMDGVGEIGEYLKTAIRYGHKALAISDFNNIQIFPKAQKIAAKLDPQFKVIYGCSLSVVESKLEIVINPQEVNLKKATICVLDFETSGLSAKYDHLIEFGAVRMEGGLITERIQFFIKCPVMLPSIISEKTSIRDSDLSSGKTIEEALEEILCFIGDSVIVAHNARFDFDFLNEVLQRHGKAPLTNVVIDTLNLSRYLHFEKLRHNLGALSKLYKVEYNDQKAHRADYDSEVLAQVFVKMVAETGVTEVMALASLQPERPHVKHFDSFVNVLAKNQEGLKDLFTLVSLAHTDYLSYRFPEDGSAKPKLTYEVLERYRQNLIISSGNYHSHLFEVAMNKGDADLRKAIAFYDVIEIQDVNSYTHLVQTEKLSSSRLVEVLRRLITFSREMEKTIIASGDVYYVHPQAKIIRDVYIGAKSIGGGRHHLYLYQPEARLNFQAPNAHFKTTTEMMNGFTFLSEEEKQEFIIDNPNQLADQFEFVYPVKKDLYTPKMEGSAEKLRSLCISNAHAQYGDPLPEIVRERLEYELEKIITNGFDVIYYIAHLLVKKSLEDGYLVGSRGSVGSSFVATMAKITEVNPLKPHFYCPQCKYFELADDLVYSSGFDLPDVHCPQCDTLMNGDGQDIPFETFLGFEADKVPDIDLNFSGEYQPIAHNYTKELFGEKHVYRAGVISTSAEKVAFGYVKNYQEEFQVQEMPLAIADRIAKEAAGVKRTTGQHPGGIIVVPQEYDVSEFMPVQYPANDFSAPFKTTHFEFEDIHDNLLKLDILGHVDPTAMKFLSSRSGCEVTKMRLNDPQVIAIFSSSAPLKLQVQEGEFCEKTGALGLPEFGTAFVRKMLEVTKPKTFNDLVRISGLSHGTMVWQDNAEILVREQGMSLSSVIACRDDIMVYLLQKKMPSKISFDIMERVRKGKGLSTEQEALMREHGIEQWYLDSCNKIQYMFPKAHAVAYVLMAVRIANFKLYQPLLFYAMYFSVRCDDYDVATMIQGKHAIIRTLKELKMKLQNKTANNKEKNIHDNLEVALEMHQRGFVFSPIDLYYSSDVYFEVDPRNERALIPPFISISGLGESVAATVLVARQERAFLSIQDLKERTSLNKTHIEKLKELEALGDLRETDQLGFL